MSRAAISVRVAIGVVIFNAVAATLLAQTPQSKPQCGSDSTFADAYHIQLQEMHREHVPSASFHWAPPSGELCSSARHAMGFDTVSVRTDAVLYVYTVTSLDSVRYAVIAYSARSKQTSEWPAVACLFDEHWKARGPCVAT